jgi:hypothetical protein
MTLSRLADVRLLSSCRFLENGKSGLGEITPFFPRFGVGFALCFGHSARSHKSPLKKNLNSN